MHTPGPYRMGAINCIVSDNDEGLDNWAKEDTEYYGGNLIAESVSLCNANLLAAAPDLLKACQLVLDYGVDDSRIYAQVSEAVRKATEG